MEDKEVKKNRTLNYIDLGLIDYKMAWDFQEDLFKRTIQIKLKNRDLDFSEYEKTPNYLIFCEHPSVYTLGKSGKEENLLVDDSFLDKNETQFYKINRGGDITFHGPGQIVGYPILDLDNFFTDIHQYLRFLEEVIIKTLLEYNLIGMRLKDFTGVWLDADKPGRERKICAMGIRCSRWVTMHGWALNANTNLDYFKNIIPCGINDKSVTTMQQELGIEINLVELKQKLFLNFCKQFEIDDSAF